MTRVDINDNNQSSNTKDFGKNYGKFIFMFFRKWDRKKMWYAMQREE
jgi:hypothetical protein